MNRHLRTRRGVTYADLIVSVCLLLLIAAAAAPAVNQAREEDFRIRCAMNLRSMGQSMMIYANDNKGMFPRTRYQPDAKLSFFTGTKTANPFAEDGAELNDVTAALYLLIHRTDFSPRWFLCPRAYYDRATPAERAVVAKELAKPRKPEQARPGTPNPGRVTLPPDFVPDPAWAKEAMKMSNFPTPASLHYSVANMYPSKAAIEQGYKFNSTLISDFAMAADINPGVQQLLKTGQQIQSPRNVTREINTPNHGGDGQNVLFADGHVEWFVNPFAGFERDNIYTHGKTTPDKGGDGIVGPPTWQYDSVLLPAAEQQPAMK